MAKLPNGLLGAPSGKVGPVVACTWKGQPYLRSLPRKRSGTPSEATLRNRGNFSLIHYWLKPLLEVVREGFKDYSVSNFGINAAKSVLTKRGLVKNGNDSYVDPSLVLLSFGDLPLSDSMEVELQGNELLFSWDPATGTGMNGRDQAMLVAYDPGKKEANYVVNGNFRMNGSDRLKLVKSGTYHLYAAFLAHDRSRQSESICLGSVEYNNGTGE